MSSFTLKMDLHHVFISLGRVRPKPDFELRRLCRKKWLMYNVLSIDFLQCQSSVKLQNWVIIFPQSDQRLVEGLLKNLQTSFTCVGRNRPYILINNMLSL